MSKTFHKTPAEVLDYKFDMKPFTNGRAGAETDYLESGETLSSFTLTPEAGITVDASALADAATSVLVWLSGGTLGATYTVDCLAVTSDARTLERSMNVKLVEARTR